MSVTGDAFNKAVDTIVKQRLSELAFDRTVAGTITQVPTADGKITDYRVSYENVNAVADIESDSNTEYKKGDSVYVKLTPDGKRLITGKQGQKEAGRLTKYLNPANRFLDMTGNLVPEIKRSWDSSKDASTIFLYDDTEKKGLPIPYYFNNGKTYKYISLSANFELSDTIKNNEASYTLEIRTKPAEGTSNSSEKTLISLNSSEMTGNSLQFILPSFQQKVVPFSEELIDDIVNNRLYIQLNTNDYFPDGVTLTISDITLSFGFDQEDYKQDTLLLYLMPRPGDKVSYYIINENGVLTNYLYTSNDAKFLEGEILDSSSRLHCKFIEYNNEIDFATVVTENYSATLHQYIAGYTKGTNDIINTGPYWKKIVDFYDSGSLKPPDKNGINTAIQENKFKACIYNNTQDYYLESPELTLLKEGPGAVTEQQMDGGGTNNLIFTFDKNPSNLFNVYGLNNRLVKSEVYSITAKIADAIGWSDSYTIEWVFPSSNTLIKPIGVEEETNVSITNPCQFKLAEFYSASLSNNTIECTITDLNGIEYRDSVELIFGQYGTSNTKYSFYIKPISSYIQINDSEVYLDKNFIGNIPDSTQTFKAYLQDSLGNEIDLKSNNIGISVNSLTWEWLQEKESKTISIAEASEDEIDFEKDIFVKSSITPTDDIKDALSNFTPHILQATLVIRVSTNENITLKATYPIAMINVLLCYALNATQLENELHWDWGAQGAWDENLKIRTPEESDDWDWNWYGEAPSVGSPEKYIYLAKDFKFTGATEVIYDETGTKPVYDKVPYSLSLIQPDVSQWGAEPDRIISDIPKQPTEIEIGGSHSLTIYENNRLTTKYIDKENYLLPSGIYPSGSLYYVQITFYGKIILKQTIFHHINNYSSSSMSSWTEDPIIDEEGSQIFTRMLSAGKIDSYNKFSGILIGEVGKDFSSAAMGIYGYNDGKQIFKIDSNSGAVQFGSYEGSSIQLLSNGVISFSGNGAPKFIDNVTKKVYTFKLEELN